MNRENSRRYIPRSLKKALELVTDQNFKNIFVNVRTKTNYDLQKRFLISKIDNFIEISINPDTYDSQQDIVDSILEAFGEYFWEHYVHSDLQLEWTQNNPSMIYSPKTMFGQDFMYFCIDQKSLMTNENIFSKIIDVAFSSEKPEEKSNKKQLQLVTSEKSS